jgi:hypothetical protein
MVKKTPQSKDGGDTGDQPPVTPKATFIYTPIESQSYTSIDDISIKIINLSAHAQPGENPPERSFYRFTSTTPLRNLSEERAFRITRHGNFKGKPDSLLNELMRNALTLIDTSPRSPESPTTEFAATPSNADGDTPTSEAQRDEDRELTDIYMRSTSALLSDSVDIIRACEARIATLTDQMTKEW